MNGSLERASERRVESSEWDGDTQYSLNGEGKARDKRRVYVFFKKKMRKKEDLSFLWD